MSSTVQGLELQFLSGSFSWKLKVKPQNKWSHWRSSWNSDVKVCSLELCSDVFRDEMFWEPESFQDQIIIVNNDRFAGSTLTEHRHSKWKRNSQEGIFCVHLQYREEPPWQHTPGVGCERCPGVHSSQDQRHHKDLSPSSSNSGSFIQIQDQTNSASAWQQETRVQWVRASDQSGANRWTAPRLGNR